MRKIKILVIGCGNMGASHALAYHRMEEFDICGLVARGNSKVHLNQKLGSKYALFEDVQQALLSTQPDAVCISTYPDTHEAFALLALQFGCHVFIEKPLADSIRGSEKIISTAKKANKKVVVGYILRHHPSWQKFIQEVQKIGKPLVMRMNLNQQSHGFMWEVHKNLMKSLSPIVDCGVHYIDVMCQMTRSKPISVSAIGVRLTNEIPTDNYNYGQLQIRFEDGSVGWYEAGWGPMISDTAFFIKDVFGPKGSVSIVANQTISSSKSDDVSAHTKTESIKIHLAQLDADNKFIYEDTWLNMEDEPNHDQLCGREQHFFYQAIVQDINLDEHLQDALNSLKIAFACDKSIRQGQLIHV